MTPDGGFAQLVEDGPLAVLDDEEVAVIERGWVG
jgi:hypothetical protein